MGANCGDLGGRGDGDGAGIHPYRMAWRGMAELRGNRAQRVVVWQGGDDYIGMGESNVNVLADR